MIPEPNVEKINVCIKFIGHQCVKILFKLIYGFLLEHDAETALALWSLSRKRVK